LAFNLLCPGILQAGILVHADFTKPFCISMDASYSGLGAVLFQLSDRKSKRIIKCIARVLSSAEKNYSVTKIELVAVVFTLKQFRYIILQQPFTIYADHSALLALFKSKFNYDSIIMTWYETIYEFVDTMKIAHCPVTKNVLADFISRTYKEPLVVAVNTITSSVIGDPDEDIVIFLGDEDITRNQVVVDEDTVEDVVEAMPTIPLADAVRCRIVVDPGKRVQLIDEVHSLDHRGSTKIIVEMITTKGYAWDSISEDLAKRIDECSTCMGKKMAKQCFTLYVH